MNCILYFSSRCLPTPALITGPQKQLCDGCHNMGADLKSKPALSCFPKFSYLISLYNHASLPPLASPHIMMPWSGIIHNSFPPPTLTTTHASFSLAALFWISDLAQWVLLPGLNEQIMDQSQYIRPKCQNSTWAGSTYVALKGKNSKFFYQPQNFTRMKFTQLLVWFFF